MNRWRQLAADIYETNRSNLWDVTYRADWEQNPWKLAGKIALIHSEIVEAKEGADAKDWENVEEEIADVAIRAMDLLYPLVDGENLIDGEKEWIFLDSIFERESNDDESVSDLLHRMHLIATTALESIRINSRESAVVALWSLVATCAENSLHTGDSLFHKCVEKNNTNKGRGIRHGGKRI
jgi:NTP pyrophosphatase (non-canonical NTP hydrolase)